MILCVKNCYPNCSDWFIFTLGTLISVIWAFYLYSFRPKLIIEIPSFSDQNANAIKIPVKNISKRRKATRIKLEVSVIDKNHYTYHLLTDSDDFCFLDTYHLNNTREFKAYKASDYLVTNLAMNYSQILQILNLTESKLRVRLYSIDSFSGLGKTEEKLFKLQNQKFTEFKY